MDISGKLELVVTLSPGDETLPPVIPQLTTAQKVGWI